MKRFSYPLLAVLLFSLFCSATFPQGAAAAPLKEEPSITAPEPEPLPEETLVPETEAPSGEEPVTEPEAEPTPSASPAPPPYAYTETPVLRLRQDSVNHSSFISGYEDGSFRPDGLVTRAEAAQMLYRMLDGYYPQRAVLGDAPAGTWYADSLGLFAWCGIIDSPDGVNVFPEEPLTRREFVTMLARLYPDVEGASCNFPDVPVWVSWYGDVAKAVTLGWIGGYEDGCFHGGRSITRAEAVTVLNRLLNRSPDLTYLDRELALPLFNDLSPEHWAYYQITEATLSHRVAEHPEGAAEGWSWMDELPAYPQGLLFVGTEQYYVDESGEPVRDRTVNGLYYGADGRYTSGDPEIDRYVREILEGILTPDMSQEDKLRAAYLYVRDNYTYLRRNYYEIGEVGWTLEEARTMYQSGMGNCYCFTSALYYLLRQIGFNPIPYSGVVGYDRSPHAWLEIEYDGIPYIYDVELDYAYRNRGIFYYNFYHLDYSMIPWPYIREA